MMYAHLILGPLMFNSFVVEVTCFHDPIVVKVNPFLFYIRVNSSRTREIIQFINPASKYFTRLAGFGIGIRNSGQFRFSVLLVV
ncbi:hypothetical protein SDC9_204142 [bioreactor metagenome]|uniref:Uncharacterized protein n=1 Tax=bioreactor metagenome TaxID=1076179 RepID=A0A645JAA7_9ZZZZ